MTAERYNYMYGTTSEASYEIVAEQRRKAWDSHRIHDILKATVEKPTPNSFAVKKEKMVSAVGDRVWVTSKDEGGWLSVTDPYNGLDKQVPIGDFRPIRVLKDDDALLYHQYVQ